MYNSCLLEVASHQAHCDTLIPFINSLKKAGQVLGIGNVKLFIATPYATARGSTSLYGTCPVSNSHKTTPKLR